MGEYGFIEIASETRAVGSYMSSCIVDLWLFEIVVYSYRRDSSPLKKGDRRMSSCDVHLFPPSS